MNYLENVDKRIIEYLNILEPEFPVWLNDYINTKDLLSQKYISVTCGTIYSNLFESNFPHNHINHLLRLQYVNPLLGIITLVHWSHQSV